MAALGFMRPGVWRLPSPSRERRASKHKSHLCPLSRLNPGDLPIWGAATFRTLAGLTPFPRISQLLYYPILIDFRHHERRGLAEPVLLKLNYHPLI